MVACLHFDRYCWACYWADHGAASIHVLEMAGSEPNLTVSAMHTVAGPTTTLSQPLDIVVVH